MIYSFAIGDSRRDALLNLLKRFGVDFESIEHDSAVVRILGAVNSELKQQLDEIANGPSLTLVRKGESNAYHEFMHAAQLPIIAGPCAIETDQQLHTISTFLKNCGVKFLRGGAYKPRTSVDSFQGLGKPGLEILRKYADLNDMFVVTEVMDRSQIDLVAEYADILQVGSRNMYNYTLLTALGAVNRPVLLKRGMSATISEWLKAAEYLSRGGNDQIILCERGIRTFEPQTSHTLDIAAIVLAKQETPYPVIADASHAAGRPDLVTPLACAAVAAGADGLMIEVHPDPSSALSDGKQALTFPEFERLQAAVFAVDKVRPRDHSRITRQLPTSRRSRPVSSTEHDLALPTIESSSQQIDPCDILAWLGNNNISPRVYWKSRDGEFELAGIGTAHLVTEINSPDQRSAFRIVESAIQHHDSGQQLQFFAGTRFNPSSQRDTLWQFFPDYWFLLPQLTIVRLGNQYLATAYARDGKASARKSLEDLLRELPRVTKNASTGDFPELIDRNDTPDKATWRTMLLKTLAAIESGVIDKAVLARRCDLKFAAHLNPLDFFALLRDSNVNSYSYYVEPQIGTSFVGASPERLFRLDGHRLTTEAVAGTIARGANAEEDRANGEKLINSRKDQLEQRYVVESIEENLRHLCSEHKSLNQPSLLKLSKVQHLVNRYEGELRPSISLADIFETIHPTPAVSGTPRTQALKLLGDLEGFDRGWYASGVGVLSSQFTEFAVAIRSALLHSNCVSLFAGAGIVPGSDPDIEWNELEQKISSALNILSSARV